MLVTIEVTGLKVYFIRVVVGWVGPVSGFRTPKNAGTFTL